MRHLILVRHGRAENAGTDVEDACRPLVRDGRGESRAMARRIRSLGLKPDVVISSSAERSAETAAVFCKVLGCPRDQIRLEDGLYLDVTAASMLGMVRALPDHQSTVLLVGHNPSVTEFLRLLTDAYLPVFPKSGAVWLTTESDAWQSLGPGACSIRWFDFGVGRGRIRKVRARLLEESHARLAAAARDVLNGIHGPTAEAVEKDVDRLCRRMAGRFVSRGDKAVLRFLQFSETPGSPEKMTVPFREGSDRGKKQA